MPTGVYGRTDEAPSSGRDAAPRSGDRRRRRPPMADRVEFGMLPVARRDVDVLRHVMQIVPKLSDPLLPERMARTLLRRPAFPDALVWMEIYGDAPEIVAEWKNARDTVGEGETPGTPIDLDADIEVEDGEASHDGPRTTRRRRRRRRGRGPRVPGSGAAGA